MPALQNSASFADQRPHPLLAPQSRSLFYAIFRTFRGTAKDAKDCGIAAEVDGIIAPFTGGDHPAIEIEYLGQFSLVKADLIEAAYQRKGRYGGAQLALFPLATLRLAGAASAFASRSAINSPTFFRNVSISHCMISRLCVAGSKSSRQGVP